MTRFKTDIRLFLRNEDGILDEGISSETYEIEQLGGQVPNVGDTIISPLMINPKEDLCVPERRTFYEVVRRYIFPGEYPDPDTEPDQEVYIRVALEVRKRLSREDERELIP